MTGAARKLLAWAPDGPAKMSADEARGTLTLTPDLVQALQRQADAYGVLLEAFLEAGLTRIMAGAEVLGTAKGQSAVHAFLEMVATEGQPLN